MKKKKAIGYGTRIKMPNKLELIVLAPWSWEGDNDEFNGDWSSVTTFVVAPLVPAGKGDIKAFEDADAVFSATATLEREILESGKLVDGEPLMADSTACACIRSYFGVGSEEDGAILRDRMRETRDTDAVQESVSLLTELC